MSERTLFFNGQILTMDDDQPTAEALLVDDGLIVAVGTESEVVAQAGPAAQRVDLAGQTLLPGFIDPHSHFMNAIQSELWADLRGAPAGPISSIPDIIEQLNALKAKIKPAPGEWLMGVGYSEKSLVEARQVTIEDLDPYFPDNPVLLFHSSNHGCVLNSAGLAVFNIDENTITPDAGIIARLPGGTKPAGFLFDQGFAPIHGDMPQAPVERMNAALSKAQQYYASKGITTAQEGATSLKDLRYLQASAAAGLLFIDLNTLPLFFDIATTLNDETVPWNRYENRLRCAGVKLLCDGSPQSLTGYFTAPYIVPGPAGEPDWRGEPIIPAALVDQVTQAAYAKGVRIFTHANGDAAIDMAIDAHRKAEPSGAAAGRRPVVVHSQFVRPDQLDTFVELGMVPTMFTNHAYYYSDAHREFIGDARTEFLSPMRSAIDRGLIPSNHSDASVTPLDPMIAVWTSVNRTSISGKAVGPEERITVAEALKAITTWAAYEACEEDSKGQLRPGMLADLVILATNPLTTPPKNLNTIPVVATYKEGQQIHPPRVRGS